MTDRERLRRFLNGAVIAQIGVFAFVLIADFALWRVAQWRADAYWTIAIVTIPAAMFTLLGTTYAIRAKRQIFPTGFKNEIPLKGNA